MFLVLEKRFFLKKAKFKAKKQIKKKKKKEATHSPFCKRVMQLLNSNFYEVSGCNFGILS